GANPSILSIRQLRVDTTLSTFNLNLYNMDTKRTLIRGTIYLTIGQVIFVISSYTLHIGLARYLGPEQYGMFGVILYLTIMARSVVNRGIPQSVSKYIAENEGYANTLKNKGLFVQAVFSIIIALAYFSCAKLLSQILHDSSLAPYIRLSAINIPFFGIYMIYLYSLNGRRWFGQQAIVGIIHDTLLPLIIIVLVLSGFSLNGAIMGLILASIVGCVVGHIYCRFEPDHHLPEHLPQHKNVSLVASFPISKIINFAIPITIYGIFTSALLNIDLLLIKGILKENIQAGFYASAKSLAVTPFFISIALSRSIFPAIARSVADNNHSLTRQYIQHSLRLLLIWVIPVVAIISATSQEIILAIYSLQYLPASMPLSILIVGLGFFTIYLILTTIITAGDNPKIAMWMNIIILIVNIVINLYLIPEYGIIGASIGTSITMLIGTVISAIYVFIRFKALIQPLSAARIIIATLPIYLLSLCIQVHGFWIIGWYVLLVIGYLIILILIKEINVKEVIQMLR
ncbi:MAG: flippase, partial [bacterium]|nr:flippase [bacterium]